MQGEYKQDKIHEKIVNENYNYFLNKLQNDQFDTCKSDPSLHNTGNLVNKTTQPNFKSKYFDLVNLHD